MRVENTDMKCLFQSQLRELEKKVELERVQYEELMLELSLNKRHYDKVCSLEYNVSQEVRLYRLVNI